MKVKTLWAVLLVFCSCGTQQTSALSGDKTYPRALDHIKKLKTEIVLTTSVTESLELAYAIEALEKAANETLLPANFVANKGVYKHLGNVKNKEILGQSAYIVPVALFALSVASTYRHYRHLNLAGISASLTISLGAATSVLSSSVALTALKQNKALTAKEESHLVKQMEKSEFGEAFLPVFNYLQLNKEETRELQGNFYKEIAKVYNRSFSDAFREVVVSDVFFTEIDKNVRFTDVAAQFKEDKNYRDRVAFLNRVLNLSSELKKVMEEDIAVTMPDAIEGYIFVLKKYEAELIERHESLKKFEGYFDTLSKIKSRIKAFENLLELLAEKP